MRTERRWIGRCVVLAGWSLLGVAVGGCGDAAAPTLPSAATQLNAQTGAGVGIATPAVAGVGPGLAEVRAATVRFHDPAAAGAAGYVFNADEPCIASPEGTMGLHTPNPALIGTQALEPTQPELLLYLRRPDGGLRLTAVEYLQAVLVRNPVTGEVGPWISPSPWPANYQVVTPTPRLFGQTFNGPMPGHTPTMPWHWDLHVWIWAHNPSGMFAQWNPALSCEG